ncbi:hypothetical protein LOS20_05015 [Enterococcus faecium]|nr:hypothetical protein [Enterococcus faecium]
MDQPTKNFVATNETRPLDYVCPRRDEQICASIDNKRRVYALHTRAFFEANFWSMNHITPTEQAYLYFMFGVMNTYLEEDLLDTPDKVQESWGWIESSIVENFEKTSRFVLQLQKKNYLYVNLAMIHLYSRVLGQKRRWMLLENQQKTEIFSIYFQ